jgi:hypothetical protein
VRGLQIRRRERISVGGGSLAEFGQSGVSLHREIAPPEPPTTLVLKKEALELVASPDEVAALAQAATVPHDLAQAARQPPGVPEPWRLHSRVGECADRLLVREEVRLQELFVDVEARLTEDGVRRAGGQSLVEGNRHGLPRAIGHVPPKLHMASFRRGDGESELPEGPNDVISRELPDPRAQGASAASNVIDNLGFLASPICERSSPSRWSAMASRKFRSVSSRERPWVTTGTS